MKLKLAFLKEKKLNDILLAFTAILLVITVISAIIYVYYSNRVSNYSLAVKSNINAQIDADNTLNNTLNNFAVSFASNDAVTKILTTPDGYSDPMLQFAVSTLLMQYKSTISEIQNIYLYNYNHNILYNCGELHTVLPEFMPTELYQELKKTPSEKTKLVAKKSDSNSNTLYQIFSSANTSINNSIIVELSAPTFDTYSSFNNFPDSRLIATNARGDIIYSSNDEYLYGSNISEYESLNAISLHSPVDFEIINTGKKEVLSSYMPNASERKYYVITPYSTVIFHNSAIWAILMCIAGIIFGITVITISLTGKKRRMNLYSSLIPNKMYGKEDVLIHSPQQSGSLFGMDIDALTKNKIAPLQTYVLAHIEAEEFKTYSTQFTQKDIDLYLYGLNNIFSELMNNYGYTYTSLQLHSEGMLYIIETTQADPYINKMQSIAQEFISSSQTYISITPSIYISRIFYGSKLDDAKKHLNELKNYKFFYQDNVVLFGDKDIHPKSTLISNNFAYKAKSLTSEIHNNSCSKEDVIEIINDCFDILKKMEYNEAREKILSLFFEFYYNMKIMISKNLYQIDMLDISKYIEDLCSASTIYSAQEIYESIVTYLYENIEKITVAKERNYLQICMDIIENKFHDPMLTPEYIAAEIGLSSSYLSKKLKEHSSVSLSSMIKDRRLTEATKLLTISSDSIGKIVSKCGFIDKSYFTVVFKKNFGCTPTEYRKNYSLNQISQNTANNN